jgi:hypothetical protein
MISGSPRYSWIAPETQNLLQGGLRLPPFALSALKITAVKT